MGKVINLVLTVVVIVFGVLFRDSLESYYKKIRNTFVPHNNKGVNVYTLEELAQYNGQDQSEVYLALMGTIFDVTKGTKHYGKGSSYHYFVGKDGSRAFITGNFKDEGQDKDHILDLTCDELMVLLNWKKTFKEKYKQVGYLIGRYFNLEGKPTEYNRQFSERIENCKVQKEIEQKEKSKYPPCNISWSADEGSRVWCTTSSGGITRSWTGVPRQLYSPGAEKPRCVCVNVTTDDSTAGMFKEYENCPKTATSCVIDS
ncbi:hypothetical protein ABMA28_014431 [Loxostege sticticalis]|uniref:Cytochrome b5 heme-binding domain-containing protein n=1 Tax=Loxostege sticticalis TaxID=481309 RepID=A0ABD0TGT4_LOXSC